MNRNQRPGGLTALGFIHILMFAAYGFGLIPSIIKMVSKREAVIAEYGGIGSFLVLTGLSAAMALLLLANGIGLLKVLRFLGRTMSLLLLVVAGADAIATLVIAPSTFKIMSITGLAYALMATGLIWSVFRRDFDSREGMES